MTEVVGAAPQAIPLPRREGTRTMLPSTWLGRTVKVEYRDSYGSGQETSGKFLDWCPVGVVLGANGTRMVLSWDALVLCELGEER